MTALMGEAPAIAPGTLPRLLTAAGSSRALTLDEHLARLGRVPAVGRALIDEVERSGLRGRGGAGFPTGVKMAAVERHSSGVRSRKPVVVANGTEGEPASTKDKTLLAFAPHLVLDGAVAAAWALGAGDVVVAIDAHQAPVVDAVKEAVEQRRASGIDGAVAIDVIGAPDRYVAGEETALVHWLNGGEAKPTFVPPRPFERGVGGRPTLVENVETLAHAALVARFGSAWYRSVGVDSDPGSMLVTVTGGVDRPGVTEVALGSAVVDVLAHAGVDLASVEAVLVGGYFGTWVRAEDLPGLALTRASLAQVGAAPGTGVLAVLPKGACGLVESARVTQWLAGENAGQCGPCFLGLPAIAGAMQALVEGHHSQRALQDLGRWTQLVRGRGACKHPDGVAAFVDSSLRAFATEIELHAHRRGRCRDHAPVLPTPPTGGWR